MAYTTKTTRVTHEPEVREPDTDFVSGSTLLARIISLIGGIIVALLGLRFLLMLLGANRGNVLVDFIYSASLPFVKPFFGMFNYHEQIGVSRFEFETLIAMLVYALLTWGLVRLLTLPNRHVTV